MPGPANTLLIEGSFEELSDELAHYIDEVQKKQAIDSASTQAEITPLLEKGQKDEVLKRLVVGSEALNSAPEKGSNPQTLFTDDVLKMRGRIHSCLQPPHPPGAPVSQP